MFPQSALVKLCAALRRLCLHPARPWPALPAGSPRISNEQADFLSPTPLNAVWLWASTKGLNPPPTLQHCRDCLQPLAIQNQLAKGLGDSWNQGGWSRKQAGWTTASVFGAAAALGLGTTHSALADALPKDDADLKAAAEAAEQALKEAWLQCEEDRARHAARLPAQVPLPPGRAPSASVVGDSLLLRVPLRDVSNAAAAITATTELVDATQSRSRSWQRQQSGGTHVITVETQPAPGSQERGLWVQLLLPAPGSSSVAHAQVIIKKRGAFTKAELQALSALVTSANRLDPPSGARAGIGNLLSDILVHGVDPAQALIQAMDEVAREMGRVHGGLFSHWFREFVHDEDRSLQAGIPPVLDGGERGFEDRGSDAADFPGAFSQRGDEEELLPPPRQRRREAGKVAEAYDYGSQQANQAARALQGMGAQVFPPGNKEQVDWGLLAGYEPQKRAIEDCLLLPLQHPEVYEAVARGTRSEYASNRPRAVLFEGPPGTGKTTSARVISTQAALPLVYVPLEAIVSKWYGESEQLLSKVFKTAEALGGAILFLDELDALATSRDSDLHEASRRLLSVLLRELDGFTSGRRSVVIGATNRKQDLDAALLSRFDMAVNFGLPDEPCRRLILKRYAKQLSDNEVAELAARTPSMSGRDLRDVCEQTERRWASKIIRGQAREDQLPPLQEYLASADERQAAAEAVAAARVLEYHPAPGFSTTSAMSSSAPS